MAGGFFSYMGSWLTSSSNSSASQNNAGSVSDVPFSTQRNMNANQHTDSNTPAPWCVQVTNAYADKSLEHEKNPSSPSPSDMLKSERKTYEASQAIFKEQLETDHTHGETFRGYAFIKHGLEVETDDTDKSNFSSPKAVEKTFKDTTRAVVTYPTGAGTAHQVYFEKSANQRDCSFFDPNKPGGKFEGPCANIYEFMSETLGKQHINGPSEVIHPIPKFK